MLPNELGREEIWRGVEKALRINLYFFTFGLELTLVLRRRFKRRETL